jgi:ribosomal protein L29
MPDMTHQIVMDRHRFITTVREGGLDEKAATAIANAVDTGLRDAVATKADLKDLEAVTRTEFAEMRAETKSEFAAIRAETKSGFAAVTAEFSAIRAEIALSREASRADVASAQVSTVKWITALILPLYAVMAGLVWQLRAPSAPAAVKASMSLPAAAVQTK